MIASDIVSLTGTPDEKLAGGVEFSSVLQIFTNHLRRYLNML